MCFLLNFLLLFPITSCCCSAAIHLTQLRQKPSRVIPDPPFTSVPNNAATATSIAIYNSSDAASSASMFTRYTHNVNSSITALPVPFYINGFDEFGPYTRKNVKNYEDIKSGFCDLTDNFCSFKDDNGTIRKASPTNMDDQCMLWDTSCAGNKTLAMERFFKIAYTGEYDLYDYLSIFGNDCFAQGNHVSQSDCDTYNPPNRLSEWQKMKDWMRSPQCVSAAEEWQNMTGQLWGNVFEGLNESYLDSSISTVNPSCCRECNIQAQNVDLYYWPEPDADRSCQSIIGEILRPIDYGATYHTYTLHLTTWTEIDWACNTTDPLFPGTFFDLPTASITSIGSLSVKVPLYNPWSSSPCIEDNARSQGLNRSIKIRDSHASIRVRDHSLIIPSSITQNGNLPVSTVVSGDFTFTSPSIYANFHGLNLADDCGSSIIETLMLSFSVGELSSIEGNLGMQLAPTQTLSTKPFDFKDLPCPPQSVMEANWYKPESGEPYRPLIAMPSKIRQMKPWLEFCAAGLFTAYDPPHALVTEPALLPPTSAGDPRPAPVSSPTQDPKTRATVAGKGSKLEPAIIPTLGQPKATANPAQTSKHEGPSPEPQSQNLATPDNLPSQSRIGPGYPKQNGNADAVAQTDPKQVDEANSIKKESGQTASPLNVKGTPTSPDPLTSLVLSIKAPTLPFIFPDPFNTFAGSHSTAANNQIIRPLSHGISVAGTTLSPEVPAITVAGSLISWGSSALVIGTSTVPLLFQPVDSSATTVPGHAITAAPNAVAVAGTTLHRGAVGVTLGGIVVSLDTGGHLVADSKTTALASESVGLGGLILGAFGQESASDVSRSIVTAIAGQIITAAPAAVVFAGTTLTPGASGKTLNGTLVSLNMATQLVVDSKTIPLATGIVGLGGLIIGGFGARGPFAGISSLPHNEASSNGTRNITNASVGVFQGEAEGLKSGLSWENTVAGMIAAVLVSRISVR